MKKLSTTKTPNQRPLDARQILKDSNLHVKFFTQRNLLHLRQWRRGDPLPAGTLLVFLCSPTLTGYDAIPRPPVARWKRGPAVDRNAAAASVDDE